MRERRNVVGYGYPILPSAVADERPRVAAAVGRWGPVWKQRLVIATLAFSDILLAVAIWGVAYALHGIWGEARLSDVALATTAPNIAVWVGLRALLGLYPAYGLDSVERLRRHTYSVFATLAILAVFALGFQFGVRLSRLMLLLVFGGLLFVTPLFQYPVRRALKGLRLWGKPVIILSYKGLGSQFVRFLEREWGLGYRPVCLFTDRVVPAWESFEEAAYEDTLAEATNLGRNRRIDTCIFAMPYTRRKQLAAMTTVASKSFKNIMIVPDLGGVTNSAAISRDLSGLFAIEIKHNLLNPWAKRLKRALDLFGALVGGLLISPLLLLITVLVKLDSSGPAIFKHRRLGTENEHFSCWKFRTMHLNAERMLDEYLQDQPDLQAEWEQNFKLRDDPRVTRVGHFLRKTSLDELPQLWNVLRGEMSLVGPRPIVDAEVHKYDKDYELYRRIKPGMTGFWQVSGRNDMDYSERVAMDCYYVRNWSVWLDLIVLARTVKVVLFGRGAY
jgi:Undecaprenyl-phosphate galactose phosphotransferase WbaP